LFSESSFQDLSKNVYGYRSPNIALVRDASEEIALWPMGFNDHVVQYIAVTIFDHWMTAAKF